MSASARDYFKEKKSAYNQQIDSIAESIIKQMDQGAGDWEMPWHKGIPAAQNMFTGKLYGGNNLLVLWNKCLQNHYPNNQWATLKQWRKVKARVKRGEKGTLICIAIPRRRRNIHQTQQNLFEPLKPVEINKTNIYFTFRFMCVFNEAQVNGYYGNQPGLFDISITAEDTIKQLVEKSGAKIITGGDRAYYSKYLDEIHIPEMACFKPTSDAGKIDNYYATLVHELIHWTGHKSRCNREGINTFGSPEYAFEELVAELGAALLCTQIKQKSIPSIDHAQYLNSWLRALKNDFSYFSEAFELARTAIYYLNKLTDIYPFLKPQYEREVNDERVNEWKRIIKDIE